MFTFAYGIDIGVINLSFSGFFKLSKNPYTLFCPTVYSNYYPARLSGYVSDKGHTWPSYKLSATIDIHRVMETPCKKVIQYLFLICLM